MEQEYEKIILDEIYFRNVLDKYWQQHPELFPPKMSKGYHLHGFTHESAKTGLKFRRILIDPKEARSCYTIYMSGFSHTGRPQETFITDKLHLLPILSTCAELI